MKTKIEIEIETKNVKKFFPEEGMAEEDCSEEQIKKSSEEVEESLHDAIRAAFKFILEGDNDFAKNMRSKFIDIIEEVALDAGDIVAEVESFDDVAELSFKVI